MKLLLMELIDNKLVFMCKCQQPFISFSKKGFLFLLLETFLESINLRQRVIIINLYLTVAL